MLLHGITIFKHQIIKNHPPKRKFKHDFEPWCWKRVNRLRIGGGWIGIRTLIRLGGKTRSPTNRRFDVKTIVIDGIIHHISHISYINDMNCFAGCLVHQQLRNNQRIHSPASSLATRQERRVVHKAPGIDNEGHENEGNIQTLSENLKTHHQSDSILPHFVMQTFFGCPNTPKCWEVRHLSGC